MKRNCALILSIVLVLSILSGCGASSDSYYGETEAYHPGDTYDSLDMSMGIKAEASMDSAGILNGLNFGSSNKSEAPQSAPIIRDEYIEYEQEANQSVLESNESILNTVNQEKLVYRANMSLETKTFDETMNTLKDTVQSYGGIIQSESVHDSSGWDYYGTNWVTGARSADITVRIPTTKFDEFRGTLGTLGNVVRSTSSVENITQQYYNTAAYLESNKNQMEVLQGMYAQATTIEELMSIEARIAEVQAEILTLTTQIQTMDMDVAFSTISISIEEVIEYSENRNIEDRRTFVDRLKIAFEDSWDNFVYSLEDILFWFIESMYALAFLVIIFFIIRHFIRKKFRKIKTKKLEKNKKKTTKNKENQPLTDAEALSRMMNPSEEDIGDGEDKE